MPQNVQCFVEECKFNESDEHVCTASSIEVATSGNDIVGTSRGTMCKTFIYKNYVHRYTTDELRRNEQAPDFE